MRRWIAAATLALAVAWLTLGVRRGDLDGAPGVLAFAPVAAAWILGGAAGLHLAWSAARDRLDRTLLGLAVALRGLAALAVPRLSDDHHRFLWDGRLTASGHDPYAATPRAVWTDASVALRHALADLWPHLNSPDYATVYPPPIQALFAAAAWIGDGPWAELALLGAVLACVDVGVVLGLDRLLARWGRDRRAAWLYGLSPLAIVELAGQRHPEGPALLALVLALLALDRRRWAWAGAALGAAVATRLLPLLLLPFVARRVPRAHWRGAGIACGLTALLLLAPMLRPARASAVSGSLRLYYDTFAFNDGVHGLLHGAIGPLAGPVLAGLVGTGVLLAAARERAATVRSLAGAWAVTLGLYQLCATTIHPWYLAPILALCALSGWWFGVVWGLVAPLTYVAYWGPGGTIVEWDGLVAAEHAVVWTVLGVEALHRLPPLPGLLARHRWLRRAMVATLPARIRVKRALLDGCIDPSHTHLDVGSGSGAVCAMLRADGVRVTPVDVADSSVVPGTTPVTFDGRTLPFDDDAVDAVLLVTVLHHAQDADRLLAEAARVARARVVVVEDLVHGRAHHLLTAALDSLATLHVADHPHDNRDDVGWRGAFAAAGLRVVATRERWTLGIAHQVVYVCEHDRSGSPPPRAGSVEGG